MAPPPSRPHRKWVPKAVMDKLTSPKAEVSAEDFARISWQSAECLLPLDLLRPPRKPVSRSGRLRQRHRSKRQVWRTANGMINLSDSLYNGTLVTHKGSAELALSSRCRTAKRLATEATLREASQYARDRRSFHSTGGHHRPLEAVVKGLARDTSGYFHKLSKVHSL